MNCAARSKSVLWAAAFVITAAFVAGMMLASAYFSAVPDNLGRMMAALGLASIFSGGMALLESAHG